MVGSDGGEESEGEQGQIGGGTSVEYLEREYVWGPGDNGFDELLVQYNGAGNAYWAIMDAGGDLIALCDLGGTNSEARVVGQWTYDAYGAVLSADHLHPMARPHLGHKGLFVDRLDVGIVTASAGPESPRLVPFAHTVCHVRSRVYSPALGRFFQRDPNATAMTLLSMSSTGRGFASISLAFSMEDLYGDGANLYEYLGSNAWNRSDPLGLSWDPFSIVDNYLAESAGSRAAFLTQIGQHATAVAVVSATIASYLPFPIVGNLGDMALYALGESSGEEFAAAMALGLIPGGKLLGKLGGFLGRIGSSAWDAAKKYAAKYGPAVLKASGHISPLGLAKKALDFIRRGCGCFEAGTVVWTSTGRVPIESIRKGDLVFAQNESTGELSLRRVLRLFVRKGAPIVAVTITTGAGSQTIRTTEEHPFRVQGQTWLAAGALSEGATVRLAGGWGTVESICFTSVRETVYNFEVDGLHNYFVGADGVLVHNTRLPCMRPFTRPNFPHNLGVLLPKNPGEHAHHVIPHRYQRVMPFDLNDPALNGAWIAEDVHVKQITPAWNRWHNSLGREPTMSEVLEFASRIEREFSHVMRKP